MIARGDTDEFHENDAQSQHHEAVQIAPSGKIHISLDQILDGQRYEQSAHQNTPYGDRFAFFMGIQREPFREQLDDILSAVGIP